MADRTVNITINFHFDRDTRVAYDTNVRGDVDTGDTTEQGDSGEDKGRRRLIG
jgi:hypothetical protein